MRSRLSMLVLLTCGCAPAEVEPASPQPGPTREQAEASPRPAFEVVVDGAAPRPASAALARPSGPGTHVDPVGWVSAQTFAYCQRRADCRECVFRGIDGGTESLSAGSGCTEASSDATTLDARLATVGPAFGGSTWPGQAAVTMVVETRETEARNDGSSQPMFKLGVQTRDGLPPAWVAFVDPCEGCGIDQVCTGTAHLDALAPSPDGAHLAALIHVVAEDGREELRLELLPTERLRKAATAPASGGR